MKYLVIFLFCIGAYVMFSIQSAHGKLESYNAGVLYSSGAPAGKTGAPGEGAFSCTECHAGGINDGTNQNILTVYDGGIEVSGYIPGQIYTVSLVLVDENVKEGFQSTVLDNTNNEMAGTFLTTGSVGTQIVSSLGRDYATHKSASSNAGNVSWDWEWQAPAIEAGQVTFYVASNIANGNGTASGDAIYLSQHVIYSVLSSDVDVVDLNQFKASYHGESQTIHIEFNSLSVESMYTKIVDLSGKQVFASSMGTSEIGSNKTKIQLSENLRKGMYVLQFFVGNKPMSTKFRVD